MLCQFSFRNRVERRRNDYDRCRFVFCSKLITEFQNLCGIFLSTVNHNPICPCFHKRMSTSQCIFHSLFKNQALYTRNNHKVICQLRFFPCRNLSREIFNTILCLFYLSSKQRVLLQARFVFNNDCRNTHLLQGANSVYKMLRKPASIAIKNNRLGGNLCHIVNRLEPGSHINQLNIRFSLSRRIA